MSTAKSTGPGAGVEAPTKNCAFDTDDVPEVSLDGWVVPTVDPSAVEPITCIYGYRLDEACKGAEKGDCTAGHKPTSAAVERPQDGAPQHLWLSRQWASYTAHNCQVAYEQKFIDDIKYVHDDSSQRRVKELRGVLGHMVMLLLQEDYEGARRIALETPLDFSDGTPRAALGKEG